MNKSLLLLARTTSFSDFASKLAAKWRLATTSTQPDELSTTTPQAHMKNILAQLVAFPTVTGNREANHDALEYIDRFLRTRGMHIKRLEWNGVESLVATTRRTKTPTILLSAHVDVVPGPPNLFTLREAEGKLYGRGTLDMKFAIAAYLQLIDSIKDNIHEYDLGILINTDEEVGGLDGAARIVEAGYLPKVLIVPDGGENWALETYAKGIWHLTITAKGKSAHASRPWEGESAIDKLLLVIAEIQRLFPSQRPTTNTINIGTIHGGSTTNQISSHATTTIDIRFAAIEDDKRLLGDVTKICLASGVELSTDVYAPPFENDPTNPYIKDFAGSIQKVIGRHAGFTRSLALNDARFFGAKGVPCVIFYPPGGNHHSPEEWIDSKSFYQLPEILLDYINQKARHLR